MYRVSTTVSRVMRVPRAPLFDWFIPVNLADILLGFGPLPGVVRTAGQTGPWSEPGSTRTVYLADGHTARETVTEYEHPRYFAYTVRDFTNVLRPLVRGATGQWWFEDQGESTQVKWTYTFETRSALAVLVIFPVTKLLWHRYMRVAMDAMQRIVESQVAHSAVTPGKPARF